MRNSERLKAYSETIPSTDTCAVIVTYHPDETFDVHLESISRQVAKVIVVDNGSGAEVERRLLELQRRFVCDVIFNPVNVGIAAALNQGCTTAVKQGFSWALTLDQDTLPADAMVKNMFEQARKHFEDSEIAIISPIYLLEKGEGRRVQRYVDDFAIPDHRNTAAAGRVWQTMTSGNLLRLKAFESVGGFKEAFFIDHVDHEFCLRCNAAGLAVVEVDSVQLEHRLGLTVDRNMFGKPGRVRKHVPWRYFYQSRNLMWMVKEHRRLAPKVCWLLMRKFIFTIVKLVLVLPLSENIQVLRNVSKGIFHGVANPYPPAALNGRGADNGKTWLAQDLECADSCPACGHRERKVLHAHVRDHFFGTPGVWQLQSCDMCGTAFLDPRLTRESISKAYVTYYTHAFSTAKASRWGGMKARVRDGYLNRRYGTRRPGGLSLGYWITMGLPNKRRAMDMWARYLPRSKPGARLLDVGCGSGEFLSFAKEVGWQVTGVDFDPKAVAAARAAGCDVVCGGIDALGEEENIYEFISLSHVLEHVHDPNELLRECFRRLKVGGQLWIQTPNIESLGHAVFGDRWRGLEVPRHISIFSQKGLATLLSDLGFKDVRHQPNPGVASSIWAESRHVDKTRYQSSRPSLAGRLAESKIGGWVAGVVEMGFFRRREFITLKAYK